MSGTAQLTLNMVVPNDGSEGAAAAKATATAREFIVGRAEEQLGLAKSKPLSKPAASS